MGEALYPAVRTRWPGSLSVPTGHRTKNLCVVKMQLMCMFSSSAVLLARLNTYGLPLRGRTITWPHSLALPTSKGWGARLLCNFPNSIVLCSLFTTAEVPDHLPSFSQPPRKKRSSLERPWSSVGQLYDRRIDSEKVSTADLPSRLITRLPRIMSVTHVQ